MKMEDLQYKRAVMLAESLTAAFNKQHATYSEAGWESSKIFRQKQLNKYHIYPVVKVGIDNKIVVTAIKEAKNEIL